MYYAVIMAGGSGTRLWPLSREQKPKQSLQLVGGQSMFQHAVRRISPIFPIDRILIATRQEHRNILLLQESELSETQFILEPEGRGTAPAIGLAAIHIIKQDPDAVMAVLTADHYIEDPKTFISVLHAAEHLAQQDFLVTLGIQPTSPSTAYGYLEHGQALEQVEGFQTYRLKAFTEKPDHETAAHMVSSGIYSWNSGMFIWKVNRILEEFSIQMPEFYDMLMRIYETIGTTSYDHVLKRTWPQIPKQTIDYGIMEGAREAAVIPVEMGWTDVGNWSSLIDLLPSDNLGNSIKGDHIGINSENSLILGGKRLIATIGIKDLVIVDTEDALLICSRDQEQKVKNLVDMLKMKGRSDLV